MNTCGAKTRSGTPCKRAPSQGSHRCRLHGGTNPGRPILSGRYSVKHRAALAEKVERFLADARPGDLTDELALMRALLDDYLGRFVDGVPLPAKEVERLLSMVETIGRLVERIARILNSNALTVAEVRLLEARLADVLIRHVDDPATRMAILDELASATSADRRGSSPGSYVLTAD